MIIFLYGPDSYRRREKLKEYLERYKAKYNALSLSHFYLEQDAERDKLKDFSQAQSLFENVKLGIVFGVENLEEESSKELAKLFKNNLKVKDLNLIIISDKKPAKEFNFLLKEPAVAHEFENLSGAESQKFLQTEIKKRDLILDKESQNLLVQVYGGDSWGLITELDKLALLNEKNLTRKILDNHLNAVLPLNIFSVLSQIKNTLDAGRKLLLLEELLFRSENPQMIFNLFSVLMKTSSEKEKTADYDAAVKSGKLEYEEALTDLVLSG